MASQAITKLGDKRVVRMGGLIVGLPTAVILLISGIAHLPIEPVEQLNGATRVDAAEHISNHRCEPTHGPICPGTLSCYDDFDRNRAGIEIPREGWFGSARCVTPVFAERYCGALETPETHRRQPEITGESPGANTIRNCRPLNPHDFITDPSTLPQIITKLTTPIPDSDQYFTNLELPQLDTEFKPLAADPASATDPPTYMDCADEFLSIRNATYQPANAQTTLLVTADLSSLSLNTTIEVSRDNQTLINTHIPNVNHYERIILETAHQPDRITITGTNCPNQNDTTTHIPATNPPAELLEVWQEINE